MNALYHAFNVIAIINADSSNLNLNQYIYFSLCLNPYISINPKPIHPYAYIDSHINIFQDFLVKNWFVKQFVHPLKPPYISHVSYNGAQCRPFYVKTVFETEKPENDKHKKLIRPRGDEYFL